MLCCVSRKSSARSNTRNNNKQQKPVDSNCSESSSGFSESSSISSGDFASSGFSGGSSSSSNTSGFSSATPASLGAFVCSSSDSSTSGFEFANRFHVSANYLGNSSNLEPIFDVRAIDSSSSTFSTSVKDFSNSAPPRLQTFLPPPSVRDSSNDDDGDLVVDREKVDKDEPPVLLPCAICTRTFMPQSLEKHRRICERAAIKKRKPFDSAKQRIQGTELAEFLPKEPIKKKVYQEEKPVTAVASKGSWKQTHDEFIRAIQAAREETTDTPSQRQTVAGNHVTVGVPTRPNEKGLCPTCNRQFSIKSYERHVAWCKERVTRAPMNTASNVAKERLEARMRYRAPLLKNRKITNREKYSPTSAINLPSYASKNSITNSRSKESASTPNCNKGENESATGCHQKPTTNARRSSQTQEGISSGPMKSRLSDRSSRPSAEIESGPTTNLSSCSIAPSINEHQNLPLSLKRVIVSSDAGSPVSTCRSVGKSGSRRLTSRERVSTRKIDRDGFRFGIDRRAIELNIFDGSKNYQKENIVSARSNGNPKINDVTINDELFGMTVHSCGFRENDENDDKRTLVTWKQIREDNMIKQTKLFESNHEKNVDISGQNVTIVESEPIVRNKSFCGIKSSIDLGISATSGIKNLNQTYLIRESLDVEKNLSDIFSGRIRRPIVISPRLDFNYAQGTPRKNDFDDFTSVGMSSSVQRSGGNETGYEKNMSGRIFLERAKLAPLDLKMIHNDEMSDRDDTSRSGGSTVSSLQTCRRTKLTPIIGCETIINDPLDSKALEEKNFESLENRENCFELSGDIGSNVNCDNNNQLMDSSRSAESPVALINNCDRSLKESTPKIKSPSERKIDGETRLGFRSKNEEKSGNEKFFEDNEVKFSNVKSKCLLNTSKSLEVNQNYSSQLDNNEELDSSFKNEKSNLSVDCLCKIIHNIDEKCYEDNEEKSTVENKYLLDTSKSLEVNQNYSSQLDNNEVLDSSFKNEQSNLSVDCLCKIIHNIDEKCYEDNEEKSTVENKYLLDNSRSHQVKQKNLSESDNNVELDFTFENKDGRSRVDCLCKIVDNTDEKISIEKNNGTAKTLEFSENTVTSTNTYEDSEEKKKSILPFIDERAQDCNEKCSESLDMDNGLTMANSCHSVRDIHRQINFDNIFESLDTPRSTRSEAAATASCRTSSPKELSKLPAETICYESLFNNFLIEENNEFLTNPRYSFSEVEVLEKNIENHSIDAVENKLINCVEKSFDNYSVIVEQQSLAKPVEASKDSLIFEKLKETAIEQPKNYQRCGTYVIERLPNPDSSTNHPVSDESLEEKPMLKRRRTEKNSDNDQIKYSPIFTKTLEENRIEDSISKKNLTNLPKRRYDNRIKSGPKIECPQSKINLIDRNIEVHEKYVNQNFNYESDNTDNNLVKDSEAQVSITREKLSISDDTSCYDLHPKAFSDSIVPHQTSSVISFSISDKEHGLWDPEKIRKKLKKKMNLLRGSTDTLISSAEACDKTIVENPPCEIEKTPRVEEETIRKIDFDAIRNISITKTRDRGFLPEITVDCAITMTDDGKEKNCSWKKDKKKSTPRLINLDPPKFRETRVKNTRQSNVGNLPPVVPASFRKMRRRSLYRDSRVSWSNYVRRHPDFNLVLTGRTGSCKDYDPYVLAERQMNELISDTCSDQSATDSPTNVRGSSSSSSPPNYPLSHSSAFSKYPDPVTRNLNNLNNRVSLIAPPSEFDDLAAGFSSDSTETNSISREILTDLEESRPRDGVHNRENKNKDSHEHVLGRRVIIDKSKALGTNEIIKYSSDKNSQTNEKARKIFDKVTPKIVRPHVTRSNSLRASSAPKAPERKNNNSSVIATKKINSRSNSGSGLNNRNNNYGSLSGSNVSLSSIVSSEVEVKRSNSLFDELASSFEDDVSCAYPSLRSLLKNDSLSVSSPVQSNRPRNGIISDEELSSPDSYQRQDHGKLSADSAYSSLNRKYSNHGRSTNEAVGRQEDDSPHRRRDGDVGSTSSVKSKLSKFCHECGCKFPETAKFCCECGIRRLTL